MAQAGELLGDLASKAGDREQLTYFNYAIDANHDRLITSDELSHLDGLGGPSQQDWLFAMAFHQGAGYQVDDAIGAKFDSATSARITPLRGDAVGLGWNPDFTNDTNPRIGEDGTIYRRSEERQAGQREIHKYEDFHRIDATIKVGVYGLLPELAAVWESFKAGLEIGQAISGRDLSGNELSADQRGAKAFGGVLGLGQAAILRMSGGQTKGALDDLRGTTLAQAESTLVRTERAIAKAADSSAARTDAAASSTTMLTRAAPAQGATSETAAASGISAGASGAAKDESLVFYSVQNPEGVARLKAGGEPWPQGPSKSALGDGFYSWGSKEQAGAYKAFWERRGATNLEIVEGKIDASRYAELKKLDMRSMSDEAATEWLDTYSHYADSPVPHDVEHIIRNTGNYGPEYYFAKQVFRSFSF